MMGANMAPTRPLTEQSPIAALLVDVGKSSDAKEYTVENAHEMKSFPIKDNEVRTAAGSVEKEAFLINQSLRNCS